MKDADPREVELLGVPAHFELMRRVGENQHPVQGRSTWMNSSKMGGKEKLYL
jgi:hypothetical protein